MPARLIGITAHVRKTGAADLVRSICDLLVTKGLHPLLETETAELVGASGLSLHAIAAQCEILLVLGGDGTLLRVVHRLADPLCPLLGINLGSLGFLTGVNSAEHVLAIESLARNDLVITRRTLLQVEIFRAGVSVGSFRGLNECVVSRGEFSRLIKAKVRINGEVLTDFHADGLIVATPTGSTAYSLAAGGPILLPNSGVFVLTPICPHVLTNRSVILDNESIIEVEPCQGEDPFFVTVDGQGRMEIGEGDRVQMRRAASELPLALLPDVGFLDLLRQKLKWSGSNV